MQIMAKVELFVDLLLIVFLCGCCIAQEKQLPNYIKKCSMKHNLKECVIKSANDAIPFIVKGDPNYNVPNMQPLHVLSVSLIDTPQLTLNLTNLEITGLDKARIIDFIVVNTRVALFYYIQNSLNSQIIFHTYGKEDSTKDHYFTLVLAIPTSTISGDYSVSGNIMVMPINGVGNFTMTLTNAVLSYSHLLAVISIKGENYYQSQDEDLKFKFDNMKIQLGNLFNGDKTLGEQVNKLLNENLDVLVTEFGPGISNVVKKTVRGIFNGIAKIVPAKNVFLPD